MQLKSFKFTRLIGKGRGEYFHVLFDGVTAVDIDFFGIEDIGYVGWFETATC